MALKNTYSKLPAESYIARIQKALVGAGALGIQYGYEDKRIVALMFLLPFKQQSVSFKLPVGWRKVQQVLRNENAARADNDDFAYRVSWAILADWVEAQMAILASENVTMPQLFLPYAVAKNGQTLFEQIESSGFLLQGN